MGLYHIFRVPVCYELHFFRLSQALAQDEEVIEFLPGQAAVDEAGCLADAGIEVEDTAADVETGAGIEEDGCPGPALAAVEDGAGNGSIVLGQAAAQFVPRSPGQVEIFRPDFIRRKRFWRKFANRRRCRCRDFIAAVLTIDDHAVADAREFDTCKRKKVPRSQ